MTAREIRVSSLVGARVHDATDSYVGRIVEIEVRIQLGTGRSDYVVDTYRVSRFGALEFLAGLIIVRELAERFGSWLGYRCVRIPAAELDISNPENPRCALPRERYPAISTST